MWREFYCTQMNILSLNLDTRILDPQSAVAERERAIGNHLDTYTLIIPYARDVEIELTKSTSAYGVGGGNKLAQLVRIYRKACSLAEQATI